MNITLSLDAELVKKAHKIAAERNSTLTDMLRDYLEKHPYPSHIGKEYRKREAA
jgi:hypothetical protein